MNVAVIFFSLTGNTKKIAKILEREGAHLIRIKKRTGLLSYLGLHRSPRFNATDYDLIILGGPVWNRGPARPLSKALKKYDFREKQVNLFVTYALNKGHGLDKLRNEVERHHGSFGREMAFDMSEDLREEDVRKLLSF